MTTEKPEMFTLKGREFVCYQAGKSLGAAVALGECATNVQALGQHYESFLKELAANIILEISNDSRLKEAVVTLPDVTATMAKVAQSFVEHSVEHRKVADQTMGKLATENYAAVHRWRPPWRAWGMLALAMCVASAFSTVVALYASRALGDTVGSCVGSTVEPEPDR